MVEAREVDGTPHVPPDDDDNEEEENEPGCGRWRRSLVGCGGGGGGGGGGGRGVGQDPTMISRRSIRGGGSVGALGSRRR